MAKKTTTTKKDSHVTWTAWNAIGWIVLAAVWLGVALALVSYDAADPPGHSVAPLNESPANWLGPVGAFIAHKVYLMLGPGAWVVMLGLLIALLMPAFNRPVDQPLLRGIGLLFIAVSTSCFVAMFRPQLVPGWEPAQGGGGLLAIFLSIEMAERLGTVGTVLTLIVTTWVGVLLAADHLVFAAAQAVSRLYHRLNAWDIAVPAPPQPKQTKTAKPQRRTIHLPHWLNPIHWRENVRTRVADLATAAVGANAVAEAASRAGGDDSPADKDAAITKRRTSGASAVVDLDPEDALDLGEDDDEALDIDDSYDSESADDADGDSISMADEDDADAADDDVVEDDDDEEAGAPQAFVAEKQFSPDELREKMKTLPINMAERVGGKHAPPPREPDFSGYQFPGMDLLTEPDDNEDTEREGLVRDQGVVLESAMQQYNIGGEVVAIDSGPTITMYEVRLAPGTKVNSLQRISSDLARSLKAQNIRIVPNMAGKDTVGVEVPNLARETVFLKELMGADPAAFKKMTLPMWLGKDASGQPLLTDLTSMPHMLIAGTTGSGKSVCMNTIIMSFLFTKRPDELKLVLVDPKMVEMSMYKDIPHLMCPVVTEMAKAAAILEWAVTKMEERYELLAEAGVRDIKTYNNLGWEELKERFMPVTESEEAKIPKKLPYMVFVIDELADLMMTNKEVEGHIVRIAQKARAVGLHLILATQRPQANVVTGLIKGNMPCRIGFKVASKLDSRIVLDCGGSELLLGNGDMLFLNPKTSKITRCQGTFVDDIEIRRTVKFLKNVAGPSFEPQLTQIGGAGGAVELGERDELFDQAVDTVLETQRGSVSLLQRRLSIGYGRASRLIEEMAAAGILGAHKGSQAREVCISLEEWEAMKAQAAADAKAEAAVETLSNESNGESTFDDDADIALDAGAPFDADDEDDDDDDVPDEYEDEYRS